MKQSRTSVKKKKREMTWAEATTEVLERSTNKVLGVRQIQEKIFDMRLKDIKMTKQSENVLKSMLAHHSNMEDCPFYKVKDKSNHYALKDSHVSTNTKDASDADSPIDMNEDSNGSVNLGKRKSKRKASPLTIVDVKGNDAESKKKSLVNKVISAGMTRRSNSYTGSALRKAQLLSRRRTSSPNVMPSSNLRSRALQSVHRSRSVNCLQRSTNASSNNKSRSLPSLDLETPSSVLTNTRLKSVVNSATFSMLPSQYQYQLIQLLPKVDKIVDDNGVPRMTQTALNNEFFSQALMDWITQLSEGEFTRETQARIMQEIAKERSKIHPWKEKFFEEYYGQKTEMKRTRSRSHDATSNLADLSFEAQLAKFDHLRNAVIEAQEQTKTQKQQGDEDGENITVNSGSDSDQDPDYAERQSRPRPATKPTVQDVPLKHINRRKISKPFKRTMVNSAGDYRHSTAMIHRKAIMTQSTTNQMLGHFGTNVAAKFKPRTVIPRHPNFQIRDEFYHSDSEASDEGELSDSNSFHQHDESDDCNDNDDESSDDLMNIGDDNLMDVDSDSDQFDNEGGNVDHSYTRLPDLNKVRRRSSDDRDWRRRQLQGLASVKPVISTDENKLTSTSQNATLVLRPKGNLEQTVQAMNYSEDSSSTSPEQPYKRLAKDQPMFEKILTVSKENTSKEERVGVLFGRNLQPTAGAYHGESIIPRISATSGLLSSPITPTTVCTSTTPARLLKQAEKNFQASKMTFHTKSEGATTLKTNKNNNNHVKMGSVVTPGTLSRKSVSVTSVETKTLSPLIAKGVSGQVTMPSVSSTKSTDGSLIKSPILTSSRLQDAVKSGSTSDSTKSLSNFSDQSKSDMKSVKQNLDLKQDILTVKTIDTERKSCNEEVEENKRPSSPVLSSTKRFSPLLPPKSTSNTQTVHKASDSANLSPVLTSSQDKKRPAPTSATSSPVKRTRTLAEIKAQMKAKRMAAASASPVKTPTPPQTSASKLPVKIAQPVFCPTSTKAETSADSEQKLSDLSSNRIEDSSTASASGKCVSVLSTNVSDHVCASAAKPKKSPEEDSNDVVTEQSSLQKSPVLKRQSQGAGISPKNIGKIILKIKSEEGKKYSVKVDAGSPAGQSKNSESDEDSKPIVRKTRRMSQVISSSGESADDLDKSCDPGASGPRTIDSYSMLSQLSLPGMYTGKVVSVMDPHLLKRTQKSPVFGEPAFENFSTLTKTIASSLSVTANSSESSEPKCQPFITDKPVIGFQDIPSCTALSSSNAPTFVQPCTVISTSKDTQKYRSTSKGKSLVQMQELARTNQIPSDDSENPDSDTEEDSNISTTSSTEDDPSYEEGKLLDTSAVLNGPTLRKRPSIDTARQSDNTSRQLENGTCNFDRGDKEEENESDGEDSYSSSSNDDKPVITDCICACKRLVLCRGCGAYTHEECLSSSKLCSLCCV